MIEVGSTETGVSNPLWLLAEVTYACPLQCPYCSNPTNFASFKNDLSTEEWKRVLKEARALGATQLGFSGGEPLVRQDLEELIQYASQLGFYTNLITSTLGLNDKRLKALKDAGLNTIQISIQASNKELNDYIAGTECFEHKIEMAKKVKALGFPLVLNFVVHRLNIDSMEQMLELAMNLEAEYVELANTQYYGFALANRNHLLPSKEQLIKAEEIAKVYKKRYEGKAKIYYVVPDYYENRPKACMDGWGKLFITVTADGFVLPCLSARVLPGLEFPNIKDKSMKWIWEESPLFNHFRGFEWMKEPCRTCPERFKDYGGCRCQAYLLTGDANKTDPVCDLSQDHVIVLDALKKATQPAEIPIIFRNPKNSKKLNNDH